MDTVKRFVEKKKVKQRSWTITSTTIVNALYKLLYLFTSHSSLYNHWYKRIIK